MKKQTSEIEEKINDISYYEVCCAGIDGVVSEQTQKIKSLLQDEKKKWKEEMMEIIGEDEDVKENKNNWLVPEYEIPIVNQFRQELRVKLNKI